MTVEDLWALFEEELETGRCGCGCSWDGGLWLYRAQQFWDQGCYEHTSRTMETYAENHWRHFSAGWKHDGRNGYGSRDGTWKDRRVGG